MRRTWRNTGVSRPYKFQVMFSTGISYLKVVTQHKRPTEKDEQSVARAMFSSMLSVFALSLPLLAVATPVRRSSLECCNETIDVCIVIFSPMWFSLKSSLQPLSPPGANILGELGLPTFPPDLGALGINCVDFSVGGLLDGTCTLTNTFTCSSTMTVVRVIYLLPRPLMLTFLQPILNINVSLGCEPTVPVPT